VGFLVNTIRPSRITVRSINSQREKYFLNDTMKISVSELPLAKEMSEPTGITWYY
jgi:hypothetical protein